MPRASSMADYHKQLSQLNVLIEHTLAADEHYMLLREREDLVRRIQVLQQLTYNDSYEVRV